MGGQLSVAKRRQRHPHLDEVMVWTLHVKKQKLALGSLPIRLAKGLKVTQNGATGTLVKKTSQRSKTFIINVHKDVKFNKYNDIYIGTHKISADLIVDAVAKWYPRLTSQSHLTREEIYPPPPPRPSTIDIEDLTVTSYTAYDLANSKSNRRAQNLRKILEVELDNRDHNHKTSVTSAHVDSLHHQKKLKAVKTFFGEDRKLFYVSVEELEQVIDDAGIGHIEYTQTMGVEGIPMSRKQRKRHPKVSSEAQHAAIKALLAETFGVMSLHVHILAVREELETVENPPPKKLSLLQRFLRMNKKKVKLRRSEVDYMISTHSGPPSRNLEAKQRCLVKVGQSAASKKEGDEESDSSLSDDESSNGNDTDSDSGSDNGSDESSSSDDEEEEEPETVQTAEKNASEVIRPHVEVQYIDGGVFAKQLVDPLGDLVGLLDQDAENPAIIVAYEPVRAVIIPTAGFLSRKAALMDAFGSHLTKKAQLHKGERRLRRQQTLKMKMASPMPKKITKRTTRKKDGGKKYVVDEGGGDQVKARQGAEETNQGETDKEMKPEI